MSKQAPFDPATGSRRETVTSTGLPGAKQLAVPGATEPPTCNVCGKIDCEYAVGWPEIFVSCSGAGNDKMRDSRKGGHDAN